MVGLATVTLEAASSLMMSKRSLWFGQRTLEPELRGLSEV
jgi:hypothetical protein